MKGYALRGLQGQVRQESRKSCKVLRMLHGFRWDGSLLEKIEDRYKLGLKSYYNLFYRVVKFYIELV